MNHFFGAIYAADAPADALMAVAREFSPRAAWHPRGDVVMDLSGLARLFGDRHAIAAEMRRTAADRGLRVRVAVADGRTTARLLVHQRPGITVLDAGHDAAALAPLSVDAFTTLGVPGGDDRNLASLMGTLRRWGISTLGAFVALPADEVAARLGQHGVRWQRVAAGADLEPLVPAVPEERFEQALDLEWPIEGLEPLSFVLSRLLEPLSAQLERRDRGAAVLHVRLQLVTRTVHERSLQLPVPMRDARTLRTLLLLDLESHPPASAIDRVVVAVDPTPGRVVQFSLLAKPLPSPEQLSTLMARLQALMGETRCGAPAPVDSWQPGACAMKPFAPREDPGLGTGGSGLDRRQGIGNRGPENGFRVSQFDELRRTELQLGSSVSDPRPPIPDPQSPKVALRRFRIPVIARVLEEDGRPARVVTDRRGITGGRVAVCAGPWRTSGGWWKEADSKWDRDEWDVTLADRVTYRVYRERDSQKWFLDGVVD